MEAFVELFIKHHGFVCRALRSMSVPPAAVDDLAQEVFIVLHRRLREYDPAHDIRSWLWGIAKRVASTHQRTMARAHRKLHALPELESVRPPDARAEAQEEADFVASVLAAMPEDQREVFVLTEIESMTAPEIAEALDINLNTVYSRLRTARERFKAALARRRRKEATA